MQKFKNNESGDLVLAVQVTNSTWDSPHPNPEYVVGVRYDPVNRTVRTPDGVVGRWGDWIVQDPKDETVSIVGREAFESMFKVAPVQEDPVPLAPAPLTPNTPPGVHPALVSGSSNPAIIQLEIYLDLLKNNEPINRREGNIEQADLQAKNIPYVEQAVSRLLAEEVAPSNPLEVALRDPSTVWYGPHACEKCGKGVVKSANEDGGIVLDASDHNHNYPNFDWQLHRCSE